ncbi:MAG: hypothetical protein O3C62_12040 [Actinomycetota bacterium]|nr:hypothetical protein [Actinomycetota bacterium]MDA2972354.1 hypothetical protein [Actinomycetota bacterium]MDA3002390.1 hypothetical protein [Actinomycetota bacterium]
MTAEAAIGFDADMPLLRRALDERGVDHREVVWNDSSIDWSSFTLVVVRSTWDYVPLIVDFLRWIDRVASVTRLENSADVMRWNVDKHYLRDAEEAGLSIVPTMFVDPTVVDDVTIWHPRLDEWMTSGDVVVKPCISAGSNDTERHSTVHTAVDHVVSLTSKGRGAMVQPYLAEVDRLSETGIVFLAGQFSHAFSKGPLLATARDLEAGLYAREQIDSRTPTRDELEVAQRASDWLTSRFGRLLYARVDLLPSPEGPKIVELELTEPSLFLQTDTEAAARAADAIADLLV